jgi:heptosyltransferase-3
MRRGSIKNRLLDLWVGTPVLHLLALFRRRRKTPERLQRIGVMCSPALANDLGRIAGVKLAGIHFVKAGVRD